LLPAFRTHENILHSAINKANSFQELLAKNVQLTRENEQLTSAVCGREDMELARNWQREKRDFEENIRSYQNILARNPYIVVLIDGDGTVTFQSFEWLVMTLYRYGVPGRIHP
jgi:hypothetical protein